MDHKFHVFGRAVELGRHGMRPEEGRNYVDGAESSCGPDRPQGLQLRLAVEAVARLGLRGRRAMLHHPPQVTCYGRPQILFASGPRRSHRRADPAAGSVHLFIGSPCGAQLELGRPVPEEGRMCVAVDETWKCYLATSVHALEALA